MTFVKLPLICCFGTRHVDLQDRLEVIAEEMEQEVLRTCGTVERNSGEELQVKSMYVHVHVQGYLDFWYFDMCMCM